MWRFKSPIYWIGLYTVGKVGYDFGKIVYDYDNKPKTDISDLFSLE